MKRIRRLIFPVILVLAVVAALWYYWVRPAGSLAAAWNTLLNPPALSSTALTASGTVETTEINVAPEAAGKILAVNVKEGDTVHVGDVLVQLDDTLLKDQRAIAASNLETAQNRPGATDLAGNHCQCPDSHRPGSTEHRRCPAGLRQPEILSPPIKTPFRTPSRAWSWPRKPCRMPRMITTKSMATRITIRTRPTPTRNCMRPRQAYNSANYTLQLVARKSRFATARY